MYMDKGHTILHERSLAAYLAAPSVCRGCGATIMPCDGEPVSKVRRRTFCSHSCAARYSNTRRPRKLNRTCPVCGSTKDYRAATCVRCAKLRTLARNEQRPIATLFNHGASKVKYARIRTMAAQAMVLWGVPKHCNQCVTPEFDSVVEVHHKRAISDYDGATLLGVVNARANLEYLCPSHHALVSKKVKCQRIRACIS